MGFSWSLLFDEQQYLLLLGAIMLLAFWAKKYSIFLPFYRFVARRVKSKRATVAIISAVSGVLPINGRVSVSAGVLDTMAPTDDKERRAKYGIIDYLSTHHYYFWSPLEKTVLLPMATLGLSYWQFMGKIWPLLATALIVILYYIFRVMKEDDIVINIPEGKPVMTKEEQQTYLKRCIKILAFVFVVIAASNVVGSYSEEIKAFTENHKGLLPLAVVAGFLASLALGSSGKFAGFVSIAASAFGVVYLPLFFAFDYAGYMLSPMHKCLTIGKTYFGTPIREYYKAILVLVIPIIVVAIFLTQIYE